MLLSVHLLFLTSPVTGLVQRFSHSSFVLKLESQIKTSNERQTKAERAQEAGKPLLGPCPLYNFGDPGPLFREASFIANRCTELGHAQWFVGTGRPLALVY